MERKQDFFDVDPFDNKRDYVLSEIGKRGFSSSLGFDYSGSSEYGIGGTSDYTSVRSSGGSGESISPARDLIPPSPPSLYSSSKSPLSSRSDYGGRFASPSSTKDFLASSHRHRSQISRRSPHLQPTSLNNYFDDIITSSTVGSRGRSLSSGTFGLVANNDGKLIGYRGSVFPGAYTESPSSSLTSTPNLASDSSNFIGGYFPGSPSSSLSSDSARPSSKYSFASSATSGSYTSTPVYYPGREEDHTYRIRDTTSQGYEDDESSPGMDESDFTIGGSSYQPSPLSSPPGSHYHSRESDDLSSSHFDRTRFNPYSQNDLPGTGFSYGPLGKSHPHTYKAFNTKKNFGSSNYGSRSERVVPYSYTPMSYNDYGSS